MDIDKYRKIVLENLKNPLVTAALGLVLGLIIGLPILGWWIFPVEWKDAGPQQLRGDVQEEYVRMMIESYAYSHDPQIALARWREMGDTAPQILQNVQMDTSLNQNDVAAFSTLVGVTYTAPLQSAQPTSASGETAATSEVAGTEENALSAFETQAAPTEEETPEETGKSKISPIMLLGILCLTLLLIGGALVYILVLRKRPGGLLSSDQHSGNVDVMGEPVEYMDQGEETPIAQFMTTYMLGDDLYDDSFSIDSPTGEFLGECGVGISETIGVGDPKKVTAFEVWLFDKNDIQTITKVLMSEHAFNDETVSQRLISKGEPILIEPGKHIILETATLQLEARVVEMNYGQGALPDNSFVDRMTLELAIWPK